MTNVEVFVSDASGAPVAGLKQEDFELLENGRPVEIVNFYAVEGGRSSAPAAPAATPDGETQPPTPLEPARLVLFVDHDNITAASRKRIFRRVRELVLEHRRDDLEIMVLSLERSAAGGSPLAVRQPFTKVPHDVFVALDALEKEGSGSNRLDSEMKNLMRQVESLNVESLHGFSPTNDGPGSRSPEAEQGFVVTEARGLVPQIHAYAQQRFDQVRRSLAALGQVVDMLAPVKGRKALVYVSDGLPMKPGLALFEGWANRVSPIFELAAEVEPQSEAARYDTSAAVEALVARANAGGVSFYGLDASAPSATRRGAAESRSSVRLSAIESFDEGNRQDSLVFLAESTGGRVGLTTSMLDVALEGVLTDFDHYYSLGYTAEAGSGDERTLAVRLRGHDKLQVRHRRSFRDRGPEELMRQRVLAALMLDVGGGENPLAVVPAPGDSVAGEGGTFVVPLLVEVPLGKLVLVPDKSEHEARVSMYVAARDDAGRTSQVTRHLCPIRIPNSEVLVALGRKMVCGVRMAMRRGKQQVAVAVRDEVAGEVSVVRFTVDVGAAPENVAGDRP